MKVLEEVPNNMQKSVELANKIRDHFSEVPTKIQSIFIVGGPFLYSGGVWGSIKFA